MSRYVYYETSINKYSIINEDEFFKIAEKNILSFSPSFLVADSMWVATTLSGCDGIINESVYKNEINDKTHLNYERLNKFNKLDTIDKITIVQTDVIQYQHLLGGVNDKYTVVAALDFGAILATMDYHEAASAAYLNIPFIFKIPEDATDSKSYRRDIIKKIKIGVYKIKNKK